MPRLRTLLIAAALPLSCCAPAGPPPPSLLPRPAEAIDPRLPVLPATSPRPVSAALTAQLTSLARQARAGDERFRGAMTRAEQLAGSAGAPKSESWIVAQEALSAAVAARVETTRASADIDAIAATALHTKGTIAPGDLAAVQAVGEEVATIDRAQAARIAAVSRRLGL
ncbi:MAG: hypothetical protein ABIQ32_10320 [Sphingomicrobium sp.]